LFILSNQYQNPKTIDFLIKFNIPFILYDNTKEEFICLNKGKSDINNLNLESQYNEKMIEESINYNATADLKYDEYSSNSIVEEIEEIDDDEDECEDKEEDEFSKNNPVILSNIISNEFKDGVII